MRNFKPYVVFLIGICAVFMVQPLASQVAPDEGFSEEDFIFDEAEDYIIDFELDFSVLAREEEDFALELDEDGDFSIEDEFLILAANTDIKNLRKLGYILRDRQKLDGLGLAMARFEPPVGNSRQQIASDVASVAPDATVDYNNIYRPQRGKRARSSVGQSPRSAFPLRGSVSGSGLKIGMIDTAINKKHEALRGARIKTRDFTAFRFAKPFHGTSVASIMVANSASYRGLLPQAQLYAASVFFRAPKGGETATTQSLVQAINWMITERVSIINMSLAGPPNQVLKKAIDRANAKGSTIVAAVGNAGPSAKPLYPAAYPGVVGITAVNEKNRVYRLANRGPQVEFAAPGVAIQVAESDGGFGISSGTSFASPFAAVASILVTNGRSSSNSNVRQNLRKSVLDLGAKGRDPIYGYGRITPTY